MIRRARTRRGVAMMLLLIALVTATIATTAFFAGRNVAAERGADVVAATRARWAAQSGLDLGTAVLESLSSWQPLDAGRLLSRSDLDGAIVDVTVSDLLTGGPPGPSTRHVILTSRAVVDGIERRATAAASLLGGPDGGASVDLGEFAVFTDGAMTLSDAATIARWPAAPASALGLPIALGTRARDAGAVRLSGNAVALDATLFRPPGASALLLHNTGGGAIDEVALRHVVPFPLPPAPSGDLPDAPGGRGAADLIVHGAAVLKDGIRLARMHVAGGILETRGVLAVVTDGDTRLGPWAGLAVHGHLDLIVRGDLVMEPGSWIELHDNATICVDVAGTVALNGAYLGEARMVRDALDACGAAPYMDPRRLRLQDAGGTPATWVVGGGSVLKACIHAPAARLLACGGSAIYGRVAAASLALRDDAALFYDHGLDGGSGYTSTRGPLFDARGDLREVATSLPTLGDGDVRRLAEALGTTVWVNGTPHGAAPPGGSSPRCFAVKRDVVALGIDPRRLERPRADDRTFVAAPGACPDRTFVPDRERAAEAGGLEMGRPRQTVDIGCVEIGKP